jgi:hypothetical protein
VWPASAGGHPSGAHQHSKDLDGRWCSEVSVGVMGLRMT